MEVKYESWPLLAAVSPRLSVRGLRMCQPQSLYLHVSPAVYPRAVGRRSTALRCRWTVECLNWRWSSQKSAGNNQTEARLDIGRGDRSSSSGGSAAAGWDRPTAPLLLTSRRQTPLPVPSLPCPSLTPAICHVIWPLPVVARCIVECWGKEMVFGERGLAGLVSLGIRTRDMAIFGVSRVVEGKEVVSRANGSEFSSL